MKETQLKTAPRLERPDEFYTALAHLHQDKSAEESLLINSKLILLLANHIGDHEILMEAIKRVQDNQPTS